MLTRDVVLRTLFNEEDAVVDRVLTEVDGEFDVNLVVETLVVFHRNNVTSSLILAMDEILSYKKQVVFV